MSCAFSLLVLNDSDYLLVHKKASLVTRAIFITPAPFTNVVATEQAFMGTDDDQRNKCELSDWLRD